MCYRVCISLGALAKKELYKLKCHFQFHISLTIEISTNNIPVDECLNVLALSGFACQQMSEYLIPTASLLATQGDQSFPATCQPITLNIPPAW